MSVYHALCMSIRSVWMLLQQRQQLVLLESKNSAGRLSELPVDIDD
jgi:hypothetical protein